MGGVFRPRNPTLCLLVDVLIGAAWWGLAWIVPGLWKVLLVPLALWYTWATVRFHWPGE